MELIFATHNAHKLEEIREAVPDFVKVMSLFDMGFSGEIPETGTTLAENASQKSRYVKERFGADRGRIGRRSWSVFRAVCR